MNKFFTWTLLCAVSMQYSYSKLSADPTSNLHPLHQRPHPAQLQKEVESISLQNFFLTPKSSNTAIKALPIEEITSTSSKPVEIVLDSSTNSINSTSTQPSLEGNKSTELTWESPEIISTDTQTIVMEPEQTTILTEADPAIKSSETNSSDSLETATLTLEPILDVSTQAALSQSAIEVDASLENQETNSSDSLETATLTLEPILDVSTQAALSQSAIEVDASLENQETNSSDSLETPTLTAESLLDTSTQPVLSHSAIETDQSLQNQETNSSDSLETATLIPESLLDTSTQPVLSHSAIETDQSLQNQETNSSDSVNVAMLPEQQNSKTDVQERDVPTSCTLLESYTASEETSSSETKASTLDHSTEIADWEFIETKNINDTQEVCQTSHENSVETKSHKTLFSKLVIGTVSTAVVLLSIVLGSK